MMKLITLMFVLFMTVYVVYSADAVIEDEDENTNPKNPTTSAKAEPKDVSTEDDYVPSEEEAAADEDEDDDDYGSAPTMSSGQTDEKNKTLELQWDGKVIELTGDDYDHWIDQFDALLVEIYAPWCGHCKDFKEAYDEVGQQLFDSSPRYFVAKIDGHKYKEIYKRFDAPGYPYFVFYKKGKAEPYLGKRKTKAMVEFVKKHGPDTVQRLNCGQLIEQKRRERQLIVYFGPSEADSRFLTVQGAARKENRFSFFWNDEPQCWKKFEVEPRSITFMTNFDEEGFKLHLYTNSSDIQTFARWMIEPQIPPIVQFDTVIGETMRSTKKPTVIMFRSEEDEFEDYTAIYKSAALANRDKAIFVWADKEDTDGNDLAKHMKVEDYGLDPGGPIYPSIRLMWIYYNKRYISQIDPRRHSVQTITEFVDNCLKFNHKEFLPSIFQEKYHELRFIPQIAGRNFEQSITEYPHGDKDIVVYFFSPECPHCAKFNPQYILLAKAFAAYQHKIKFMSMDAVNNMVEGINIARFPVIRYFPREVRNSTEKGVEKVKDIATDSRDLDVIADWLLKNSEGLKEEGVTLELLFSPEGKEAAEIAFNETQAIIEKQAADDQARAKEIEAEEKKEKREAAKKQKEEVAKQKELSEARKKMQEEKAKVYHNEEKAEEDVEVGDDGYKVPSERIPGKKRKAQKGDRKFDDDGNELFERPMSDIGM